MQTIHATQKTDGDGTLALSLPLGQPNTEFEVVVVVQAKTTATGKPAPSSVADQWARIDAFRERLAASGRDFGDSVQDIREDRDR
jgi:hypothetical protein